MSATLHPSTVSLRNDLSTGWQLWRDGRAFLIHGVGGGQRLDLLAANGGTAIRTWHEKDLEREEGGRTLLDRAGERQIAVMAGIWLGHERHGFDYSDVRRVEAQRSAVLAMVRRYKEHPAILIWGLGNETEGLGLDGGNPLVWRELEVLARLIKEEDPHHPVCTVLAGPGAAKLANFARYCPSVDILGINAYGDALHAHAAIRQAGITRPHLLTEFGPIGHWERPSTPWGAPLEPGSLAKAECYLHTHHTVMREGRGNCLGTFAFLWGHKQEVTPTWYGMFLPSGEKTPAVDAMVQAWTGRPTEDPSPRVTGVASSLIEATVGADEEHDAEVKAHEPRGGGLSYEWFVMAESTDRKEGGDPEGVPPVIPGRVVVKGGSDGARVVVRTPTRAGAYRLFVIVRNGRGGGAADNFPFRVA